MNSPNKESHYEFGASGAKTWRWCKGSINYARELRQSKLIPENNETSFSSEGTVAHLWADKALSGIINEDEIPANFREHLQGYIDFAKELVDIHRADMGSEPEVMFEQQVPLFYAPEHNGTLDFAVIGDGTLDILDLKYGAGIWVDVMDNDQLAIYALSLVKMLEDGGSHIGPDTMIRMHIYQPRHRNFDGNASSWVVQLRDLRDLAIDIEMDYVMSKSAEPDDLRPSADACQFCDAKAICEAKVAADFDVIPEELDPRSPKCDPDALDPDSIEPNVTLAIFEKHKRITKWMGDYLANQQALIEQGAIKVPGLKVVKGKDGNRGWGSNEEAATKLFRKIPIEHRFKPRRVISPAQAEKVMKKLGMEPSGRFLKRFRELVYQKPGGPTLALESDPRESIVASDDWDDLTEDETLTIDDCI